MGFYCALELNKSPFFQYYFERVVTLSKEQLYTVLYSIVVTNAPFYNYVSIVTQFYNQLVFFHIKFTVCFCNLFPINLLQ